MSQTKIRFLTRSEFVELTRKALRESKNRAPNLSQIMGLPEEARYPIVQHAMANDKEIRATIALNSHGQAVTLDMDIADFNRLSVE